ncbi:DUF1993 family protein [Novosphingobium resinovorum]|uniref:DUF1993 family protein n=1 Tax=Novosphingobium sp. HR1a TaxID=1395637 RepID=UPI00211322B2|nr:MULTISPECIES: DUF1993 family protein [Novosphingobium]WJM26336.1 DUF1993 family protein [Novosphingobium resinovorum]
MAKNSFPSQVKVAVRFLRTRASHIDVLAGDVLLSFSQPSFYFHATAAYDILRMKGVQIGKRDFYGRIRKKPI